MKCPKCNAECLDNYCTRCGVVLQNSNLTIKKENPHERDLELFVGNNSEKIIYRNFNISAAIFNFLYYSYRKCYLFSIILFIIEIISFYSWKNVFGDNYKCLILANILFFLVFGNSIDWTSSKQTGKIIARLERLKEKRKD